MADSAFTVKVDGRTFVLDRITLGDWHMFKTHFGLKGSDIVTSITNDQGESVNMLNLDDPSVLIALIVAALHHERPQAPVSSLVAEVEALTMDGLEFPDLLGDDEPDPTKLVPVDDASEATDDHSPVETGSRDKRQKKPGTRR